MPSDTLKTKANLSDLLTVNIEIEDFQTFQEVIMRAIEQFNIDFTQDTKKQRSRSTEVVETNKGQIAMNILESRKSDKKICLKLKPELYKIRIGKKKTGLPNYDYPAIISNKTIKNSNFTALSIVYDESHIEDINSESFKSMDKNNNNTNKNKKSKSNQKLVINGSNRKKSAGEKINHSSVDTDDTEILAEYPKKCCNRCLIF